VQAHALLQITDCPFLLNRNRNLRYKPCSLLAVAEEVKKVIEAMGSIEKNTKNLLALAEKKSN
jgi:hypothetical protein